MPRERIIFAIPSMDLVPLYPDFTWRWLKTISVPMVQSSFPNLCAITCGLRKSGSGGTSLRSLDMRFDKPQRFVDASRYSCKQVSSILIACLVSDIYGSPHSFSERRKRIRKSRHVRCPFEYLGRIGWELRFVLYHLNRPVSNAAKLGHPFRDRIYMVFDFLRELVEQLMQGNKAGPFDIPMRLLSLQLQIDRVR